MSGAKRPFLDTNIVVYLMSGDATKASKAESLIASGGVISTQAFGESAPRVETADGVRELQNRRVEITYGPGSGM